MRQKAVVVGGVLLVLLSLMFVANKVWLVRSELLLWRPDLEAVLVLLVCVLLYALGNFSLSSNWKNILVILRFKGSNKGA